MRMTERVSKVFSGMGTPARNRRATNRSEKWSAAKALPRKPDRVMAI